MFAPKFKTMYLFYHVFNNYKYRTIYVMHMFYTKDNDADSSLERTSQVNNKAIIIPILKILCFIILNSMKLTTLIHGFSNISSVWPQSTKWFLDENVSHCHSSNAWCMGLNSSKFTFIFQCTL